MLVNTPQAVLFDLDGTLVDSVPGIHQALHQALSQHTGAGCSINDVRHWVGNGPHRLVQRGLTSVQGKAFTTELLDATLNTFNQGYAQCVYNGALYSGVADGLWKLQQAGLRLACITNKPWPFTEPYLEHLGIAQHFDTVICADQVTQPKPHPESLSLACTRFDIKPGQAVMVGDSVNDLAPALALEMPAIAVSYGYHQNESLADQQPVLIADSFADVLDALLKRPAE